MSFEIEKPLKSFSIVAPSTVLQPSSSRKEKSDPPKAQPESTSLLNYSIGRMNISSIQTKLTIGKPGDRYEQEADHVAGQVMSMPDTATHQSIQREARPEEEVQAKPLVASITPLIQREEMPEEEEPVQAKLSLIQREEMPEEEEPVQAKSSLQRATDGSLQAGGNLESQLSGSKGGGSPLSNEVRSFMEPRFGTDFSQVKVHTDTTAVQMSQSIQAQAFTHGSDIYFNSGKYSPATNEGKSLLAHELTHVVQQKGDRA